MLKLDHSYLCSYLIAILAALPIFLITKIVVANTLITECGSSIENVTPSTLASKVGGSGCKTLVLTPGTYPRLSISNRTSGILTLRCSSPGECIVGTGSVVSNVNGLIIDGIQIRGGAEGLRVKGGSKNVLVQRSKFIEQTSAGLTLGIGTQNDNIQIYDNEFRNAKLGCQYNSSNCTGYLSDGSPVAEMDYGLRVYDTKSVDIKGNLFGTMFNHAISLKYSVVSASITNNTFDGCGRTCIELGQDSPACGEAVGTGNVFKGKRLHDVYFRNLNRAVITDNTFIAAKTAFKTGTGPAGRVIIKEPNTFQ